MNSPSRVLAAISLSLLAFTASLQVSAADELFTEEEIASTVTLPEVDEPPQPTKQVQPDLPAEMRGRNGYARVGFLVDETGAVVNPRIQKSSDARFDEPTLDAIARWKFDPAKKGGQTVSVRVILPFRFNSN